MPLLELHRVGEPAHDVAQRADWKLDEHLPATGVVVVVEQRLVLLRGLDAEVHVIALGAVDAARFELGLEQDVAGVEIAQAYLPGMLALGQQHAAAAIEIKAQALGAFLRRHLGRRGIVGLDRWSRCRLRRWR